VKEGSGYRATGNVFRVTLDDSATQARDLLQCALERCYRDSLASVAFVYKEASDSPVWKSCEAITIGTLALDAWKFVGRAELAPSHAGACVVNEGGMSGARSDSAFLFGAVVGR